jgi:exodeoxyribonuclease VII large subunit
MFRGRALSLRFMPRDGLAVRAKGAISLYPARGAYQIICDSLTVAGEGDILAMLEERKRRLAAEGLFEAGRKRPLPRFPSRVVVITSPHGAAVRDVISVIRRRNPAVSVRVLPALVQGEGAAAELVHMLQIANKYKLGDVIIIGRGGGSIEDLLPFSDEAVVRAVAASQIPTVSAVGHEVDWSLSDFAADLRAPTPSAAAELCVPELDEITEGLTALKGEITDGVTERVERIRRLIEQFSTEELEYKFRSRYQPLLMRYDDAREALVGSFRNLVERRKLTVKNAEAVMRASHPETILARGYAIAISEKTKKAVKDARELEPGDKIDLRFAHGGARAVTEETHG